ncbi:MAG: AcrR family transcriptional regulator [Myxococcota bacterium]|jgi:AcrR family transcriptional regulator
MPSESNRDLLLDAAEVLFAERGVGRVSMRSIQIAAGRSVGSIQYHFDDETDLLRQVLDRRANPLSLQRLKALRRLSKSAEPTTRKLVDIMLAPLVRSYSEMPERALLHVQIIQRMQVDHLMKMFTSEIPVPEVQQLAFALLCRIMPDIPPRTIVVRLGITWETIVATVARWQGSDQTDFTQFATILAEFLAGALEAPTSVVRPSPTNQQTVEALTQLMDK